MVEPINLIDRERRTLSKAVNRAALALLDRTKAASFLLRIPHTTPQMYVVAGTADEIRKLVASIAPTDRDCLDS